jgi:hypothetical protein
VAEETVLQPGEGYLAGCRCSEAALVVGHMTAGPGALPLRVGWKQSPELLAQKPQGRLARRADRGTRYGSTQAKGWGVNV